MHVILEAASITYQSIKFFIYLVYKYVYEKKGVEVHKCAANPGLAFVGVQGQHKDHF